MGTTLTGTTPQDTYDSLIKVTDNGPISGTLKALSDGLGNDSTLSLSTTAASIAGTLAVTGITTLSGAMAFNNNDISQDGTRPILTLKQSGTSKAFWGISSGANDLVVGDASGDAVFRKPSASGAFRFTTDGGNSSALVINSSNVIEVASGIQFPATQVASANANTLDDYEEGTWTMGITFGGASVGVTYSQNTGTYTKIGRKVTVNGRLSLTSKGSSTGNAEISGLPFTIGNTQSNYSAPSFRLANISFTNVPQAFGLINGTSIALEEITILGADSALTNADFVNTSDIMLSFTYFV